MRVPGFVDLQVNGFKGIDFSSMDLSEDDCASACRGMLATGTAAFLPTIITSSLETYRHNLPILAKVVARSEFTGRLLGIHLEGPFISGEPGAVGAHDERYVRAPDAALLEELVDLAEARVKILTMAAELPGADELARRATELGIVVSLGHQLASGDDIERLAAAGARSLTHLGNGVPNILPRHPNPIWSAMAEDRYRAMIITDGHHLPKEFIMVTLRVKGVDNTIVVSDAAPIAGMPAGRYRSLGAELVLEENGKLHDPAKGCMAGSSATMLQCMNHLASLRLLSLEEMIRVGRHNPLRLIGVADEDTCRDEMLEYSLGARVFRVCV